MEKRIAKNRGDRFIPYMSKEDTEALHEALVREERWGMAKMYMLFRDIHLLVCD